MIELFVPVETVSLTNQREAWRARHARSSQQRADTRMIWLACGRPKIHLPAVVLLIRVSPRGLDDDNLRGALKHVRDEVAAIAGVDDRDPRIRFEYDQAKGEPEVRIQIMTPSDWKRIQTEKLEAWVGAIDAALAKENG